MRPITLLCALTLLLQACRGETPQAKTIMDTPVFVISIDTLRSDRLPVYGYTKGRTPAIDTFRNDAILFRNAFSSVPLTLPSHATMLTGLQPYRHGVRDNLGYGLDPVHRTLPSILSDNGWKTGAAVSSYVLRRDTGIAAGFSFFDDLMTISPRETISAWQREGDRTRAVLEEWLDSAGTGRVFGFLHLYEPHTPYAPPEPWASQFADPYDGEIAAADAIVGRFLDDLRKRGLYDRSLIIILSDHGEGLGDHGEPEHGVFVYRESIQIPLIVKLPGGARHGEEVTGPVSLADIMPTVLEQVGIEPAAGLDGISLLAPASPSRMVYSESYYPRFHYGWSELHSLAGLDFHFIDAPVVELYSRASDPSELSNVADANRRVVAAMRKQIAEVEAKFPLVSPGLADPEDARKLAALGYLGAAPVPATGDLPDPKAKVGLIETFGQGAVALKDGDTHRAIEIAKTIVAANPQFLQGWGLLSSAHRKQGDLAAALEALESQMRHAPGSSQTALSMASILLEMKRYAEAKAHAELVVGDSPAIGHEMLATIALAAGDLPTAETEVSKSLEAGPLRVQPLILLSEIRQEQNAIPQELEILERIHTQVAQRRIPPIRDLELRRGEALLRLSRPAEAEGAFRAEVEVFPDQRMAWAKLALVIGGQGRLPEARATMASALAKNPGAEMKNTAREVFEIMNDQEGARRLGLL